MSRDHRKKEALKSAFSVPSNMKVTAVTFAQLQPIEAAMTATSPTVIHIRQGATPADSIDHASCLLRGIRVLAEQGVDQDGMDADTCYLVGATVDTLIALLAAIDVPVSRAA